MELKELIEKWDEQIAMHRRVVEDPLMWTKEDRQKSSHQTQALCAIMDDIKKLAIPRVSNCATSMEEILNEAQRRKAKHSVQYADYSLDTWTVANDLLEHRKKALLADGSVRKVRIEYEM